jgi:hypothetical protein
LIRTREDAAKFYRARKISKPDIIGNMLASLADVTNTLLKEQPNMRIPEYPKSEVETEQAKNGYYPTKWWQAFDDKGRLLAETSSRSDFKNLNLVGQDGVTFNRLYEKKKQKWVDEHPFPQQEEWRVIPSYPRYEISMPGQVRCAESKELLKGVFVGEAGGLFGYLLRKGTVSSWLKTSAELLDEAFPDLKEARKKSLELNTVDNFDHTKPSKD